MITFSNLKVIIKVRYFIDNRNQKKIFISGVEYE